MKKIVLLLGLVFCASTLWAVENKGANFVVIKDLHILNVIYRGPTNALAAKRIDDKEVENIKKATECGRLFYFRNTRGELNLTFTYLLADIAAPETAGPTFDNIEKDLVARGYVDNQFDGIFVTGVGLKGNWGGFKVFDKTGAAFGIAGFGGQLRQFPSNDSETAFDTAWVFVHEFQHALDIAIAGGFGFQEFLHGHPYTDFNEHQKDLVSWVENPGGQHWDWEACTLRNFKNYITIPGATCSYIYALDADHDGLADYHPSLPMDEARFGSSSQSKDTDLDGLSDLDEFTADVYFGSNPQLDDSDLDGIGDNQDKWPTVAIAPSMAYAYPTPKIDAKKDDVYRPLFTRYYATSNTNLPLTAIQCYASWDEDNLYFYITAPEKFGVEMQLDSSAENGFWIGGDTYVFSAKNNADALITWPKDTPWPNAKTVWKKVDGHYVLEMVLPADIGFMGVTSGQNLVYDTANGLELLADNNLSFNFAVNFSETKERVLMTPTWSMISTQLEKNDADPDNPIIRYSQAVQSSANALVEIAGIKDDSLVFVKNDKGLVLGCRTGAGQVTLEDLKIGSTIKNGLNEIYAETADNIKSANFGLSIDCSAAPPVLTVGAEKDNKIEIDIAGEAYAWVTVERKVAKSWLKSYSVQLGSNGLAKLVVDTNFKGFDGTYFNSKNFTEPVFYRIDPIIDFNFKDQKPEGSMLPGDQFSVRWESELDIKKETVAELFLTTDDGGRLFIDGKKVIDNWGMHSLEEKTTTYTFKPGFHKIRVDYYEDCGWAGAHLAWQPTGQERTLDLPVKVVGQPVFRAYQIDAQGNQSDISK